MRKFNVLATAAIALTLASVSMEGQASSTYVFNSTTTYTKTNVSGTTDPNLSSFTTQYAANGGTYTSSSNYSINGYQSGAKWTSGTIAYYSGGGLGNVSDGSTSPNHAIDNGPKTNSSGTVTGLGNTESVLLSFSSSVVLNSIGLGYVSGDADVSLFRYTGTTAPTITGTGAALGSMVAAGWELVGNYADLKTDTTNPYNTVNAGGLGSSWWLISAYNTSYGTTSVNGGVLGQGNDYFKLYAVAATKCTSTASGVCTGGTPGNNVPEPGSLALVAIGCLGMVSQLRKRKASV